MLVVGCALAACTSLDGLTGGGVDGQDGGPPPEASTGDADDAAAPDGGPCPDVSGEKELLAYYPLDEGSGTTVIDCSGHGVNGTMLTAVPDGGWTTGHRGGALRIDGQQSLGCIELGFKLAPAGPFTIAAWVNVASFPANSGGAGYIVGKTKSPTTAGWRLAAGNSTGTFVISATAAPGGDVSYILSESSAVTAGTWLHIAAVFVPNGNLDVYLGGALSRSSGNVGAPLDDPASTARLGCRSDGSGYFDGALDEVRIYGRALDATEIAALAAK
jgi:hypothetical protein